MDIGMVCAALVAAAAAQAPFSSATVYGDRARVVRTAEVRLSGAQVVEFPALTDRIDPSSVRVEAEGAEVVRVELQPLSSDQLELSEAKRLLASVEKIDVELAQVTQEQSVYAEQLNVLKALHPTAFDRNNLQPAPKLDPSGWDGVMKFTLDRIAQLQQRQRAAEDRAQNLSKERERLGEEARLIGGLERRSGLRVLAHLNGQGTAKVHLSYVSTGATWTPRYELQLDPATNEVAVSFFALVQQDSGEDWSDVGLTLSTARPLQAMAFPKVATWKIGERDRFIPTPAPAPVMIRRAPVAPPLPRLEERAEVERVRAQLEAKVFGNVSGQVGGVIGGVVGGRMAQQQRPAPKRQPMPASPGYAAQSQRGRAGAPSAAPEPMPAAPPPEEEYAGEVDVGLTTDDESVTESSEFIRNLPVALPEGSTTARSFESTTQSGMSPFGQSFQEPVVAAVGGLSPPPSFRIQPPPPNSPAAKAGGYDLAFSSVQRESIPTGKGPRRVALFTERWPVKLERRLFPALSPHAYLAAELKSPSKRVLPGGSAALFVGQDPAGNAELNVVAPNESFTLPLGVDRAVKGVRNVDLTQAEEGFIGKDDVGVYTVSTEVANPYKQPLEVRIHDQWPLKGNADVEIKLTKVEPAPAAKDENKGTLEWKMTIAPGTKQKVSFTYSLKRPKNWRLQQQQEVAP